MKLKQLQIVLLLTGCASPPDELWYCQQQGAYLYCVPERSIDALSGTRNAGIAIQDEPANPAP
jgi:hypothetical protein